MKKFIVKKNGIKVYEVEASNVDEAIQKVKVKTKIPLMLLYDSNIYEFIEVK